MPPYPPHYPGADTRQDAEQYVEHCLGQYAVEHDVPAIADRCYEVAGSWDVRTVDAEHFWLIVRGHAIPKRRPARWQAHADTDGLSPGQPEPEQGQPVTEDDMRRIFGL